MTILKNDWRTSQHKIRLCFVVIAIKVYIALTPHSFLTSLPILLYMYVTTILCYILKNIVKLYETNVPT